MIPQIHTSQGVTAILFSEPYHVAAGHPRFDAILELLTGNDPGLVLAEIEKTKRVVQNVQQLSSRLAYVHGEIQFDGSVIHGYAVDKLVALIEEDKPVTALVNFLVRVQRNPSFRVVAELYKFLEHGRVPLTEDGCFVAYKAIRKDWTDIHSGTFENRVGNSVRIARNQVDEDPDRTCSRGLHVCSFDYLQHFAHADGRVVAVKVDPADVVAIPRDYNDTKMRTCGYVVIDEVTDYYGRKENVLSSSDFYEDRHYSAQYQGLFETDWVELSRYADRDAAEEAVLDHQIENGEDSVRVIDRRDGKQVYFAAGE